MLRLGLGLGLGLGIGFRNKAECVSTVVYIGLRVRKAVYSEDNHKTRGEYVHLYWCTDNTLETPSTTLVTAQHIQRRRQSPPAQPNVRVLEL